MLLGLLDSLFGTKQPVTQVIESVPMKGKSAEVDYLSEFSSTAETPIGERESVRKAILIDEALKQGQLSLVDPLGVEKLASDKLTINMKNLTIERQRLELNKYPKLSLKPLSWRNAEGLPRLAIFSLDSPEFRISVSRDGYNYYKSSFVPNRLSSQIVESYADVVEKLKGLCEQHRSYSIGCTFNGFIPTEVKKKIFEARADFSDSIFIIAAPDTMSVSTFSVIEEDPLVVGFKYGALWLITDFDLVPVEEAMITHIE